jgi:2-aminoethylphosphonate-pyruvate transaminase
MILLNPGPVTLSPRVRAALAREDLCHREPEFADLTNDIRRRLENIYPDASDFAAVLLTGSGTAAVEAMLTSLVRPDEKILVISNGVYGARMSAMLLRHRRPYREIVVPWEQALPLQEIEAALEVDPDICHVAVVHHETTTGRLNDLDGLGRLCRARDIGLLLDAVSSFGAEPLKFAEWNLVGLAAAANKCLHGVPGVSFVLGSRMALERADGNADSMYLDLAAYFRDQAKGWSPFTQSVQGFLALQEALRELEEDGGQAARHSRYLQLSGRLRSGLRALGIATLIPEPACASMLTAFRLPEKISYAFLHDRLKQAGFVIYAGQGRLAESIFRIAVMGQIEDGDMDRLLLELRQLMEPGAVTR